jgi:hypothetical protein
MTITWSKNYDARTPICFEWYLCSCPYVARTNLARIKESKQNNRGNSGGKFRAESED